MATSLSQAYTDTHFQPKDIIPLDFGSIREVPESHQWTQEDGFSSEKCARTDHESVPIIDLNAPDVVEHVRNACQRWGMFQVTNHQVPLSLVDDVEEHVRRLFALPVDRKLQALRSPNGATGYGVARISPFFSKLMWHEGFTIMGSAVDHAKLLWPNQYQEFCDAMEKYEKEMRSLAHKILVMMIKALGEDEKTFYSSFLNQSVGALQLNSYPSCPNPSQAIGLAPHTDTLLLTILHQNDTNGLQLFKEDIAAGWIPIPPVSGALIINIGDLMHIISNARFPPVYHRVIPNDAKHRYTFAYFCGPPPESVVEPLPGLSSSPHFLPVITKDYIALKNKHLHKALNFVRNIY